MIFSADETADVGRDTASPVSDDYEGESSVFTGTVNWVQIDLGEDAEDADHLITPEERLASQWRGSDEETTRDMLDDNVTRPGSLGGRTRSGCDDDGLRFLPGGAYGRRRLGSQGAPGRSTASIFSAIGRAHRWARAYGRRSAGRLRARVDRRLGVVTTGSSSGCTGSTTADIQTRPARPRQPPYPPP